MKQKNIFILCFIHFFKIAHTVWPRHLNRFMCQLPSALATLESMDDDSSSTLWFAPDRPCGFTFSPIQFRPYFLRHKFQGIYKMTRRLVTKIDFKNDYLLLQFRKPYVLVHIWIGHTVTCLCLWLIGSLMQLVTSHSWALLPCRRRIYIYQYVIICFYNL